MTRKGYSADLRERVFAVWLLDADRNAGKAARILAETYPNEQNPSDDTIRNWADEDNWALKAHEYFAEKKSEWMIRFDGRLMAQYDRLLTWQDALIDPDHPQHERFFGETDQNTLTKERAKRLTELEKTIGVGQHGQKVARLEIPLPHDPADASGKALDIAANFRNRQLKQGGGG